MGANNCASQGPQACAQGGSQQSPRTPKVYSLWLVMLVSLWCYSSWILSVWWQSPLHNPGQAEEDDVSRLTMWEHDVEAMKEDSSDPPWWLFSEGHQALSWEQLSVNPGSSEETRAKRTRSCCPASPRSQFFFVITLPPHWFSWWTETQAHFLTLNAMPCKSYVPACVAPSLLYFPRQE